VGAENRLDLAAMFVIPPFVKIARARLGFIVKSGNNVKMPPFLVGDRVYGAKSRKRVANLSDSKIK